MALWCKDNKIRTHKSVIRPKCEKVRLRRRVYDDSANYVNNSKKIKTRDSDSTKK